MPDLLKTLAYILAVLALLATGEALRRRFRLPGELTRKLAHVTCGLLGLSFLFFFDVFWPVAAITFGFAFLIAYTKAKGGLGSIHDVGRATWGAALFPIAIAICFYWRLKTDNDALYASAIAVLALADPAAALAGQRWPWGQYRVFGHGKTVMGSFAFFITALLASTVATYALSPGEYRFAPLLAGALGAAAAEAVSGAGLDNLTIPVVFILFAQFFATAL